MKGKCHRLLMMSRISGSTPKLNMCYPDPSFIFLPIFRGNPSDNCLCNAHKQTHAKENITLLRRGKQVFLKNEGGNDLLISGGNPPTDRMEIGNVTRCVSMCQ